MILPCNPSKLRIIIHNNMLFIVQQNKIKVCNIEKALITFEKEKSLQISHSLLHFTLFKTNS